MARPIKKGLDYFPLECDFFESNRYMIAISGEFGLKGECAVLKLLCAIFKEGYFLEWNELTRGAILKKLEGVSPALLDEILQRLVRWGYFDKPLFDSMGVITSKEVQSIYFDATKRRIDSGEDLPHLLIDVPFKKVNVNNNRVNVNNNRVNVYNNRVNVYNNRVNVDINTQSKVNKRKELSNESKKTPPACDNEMSVGECYEVLSGSTSWIETITMNYRSSGYPEFTPDVIREYLTAFFQRLQNEGITNKSPRDAMSHFARWLQIEVKHENNRPALSKQQANAKAASELYAYCADGFDGRVSG